MCSNYPGIKLEPALGKTKLDICHHNYAHVVHKTAKQVIPRLRKNENVFKMSKDEKCTCKAWKNTVFHCQICKFVGVFVAVVVVVAYSSLLHPAVFWTDLWGGHRGLPSRGLACELKSSYFQSLLCWPLRVSAFDGSLLWSPKLPFACFLDLCGSLFWLPIFPISAQPFPPLHRSSFSMTVLIGDRLHG